MTKHIKEAHSRFGKANLYRAHLALVVPRHEQPDLERLHAPIESAIAAAKNICENYESCDVEEHVRELVWEEESSYTEDLIGVAFVISQARLTKVATRIIALHDYHARSGYHFKCMAIPSGKSINERKKSVFKAHSKVLGGTSFTEVQVINAFANYYKHHDEWNRSWAKGAGKNNFSTFTFDFSSFVMNLKRFRLWEEACSSTLRGTLRAGGSTLSYPHHSL